jgi:thymidine kinase
MAQLYFYYSAMNAGKSTTLLQSAFNYQERGMNPMIFTAAIDDRYGVGKVSSRIGLEQPALLFDQITAIFDVITAEQQKSDVHCIMIDEAQFLTKSQVWQLSDVVDKLKIPVLCYGLRTDFQGEMFPGSAALLAWADKLIELKTICHCGKKAIMVVRLNQDGEPIREGSQVAIGGNDQYVSMCRAHFKQALGR